MICLFSKVQIYNYPLKTDWKCLKESFMSCNCINAIEIHSIYVMLSCMKNVNSSNFDFYIFKNKFLGFKAYDDVNKTNPIFPVDSSSGCTSCMICDYTVCNIPKIPYIMYKKKTT